MQRTFRRKHCHRLRKRRTKMAGNFQGKTARTTQEAQVQNITNLPSNSNQTEMRAPVFQVLVLIPVLGIVCASYETAVWHDTLNSAFPFSKGTKDSVLEYLNS